MRRIVVHSADTPASMDIGAGVIRDWHLNRGWSDIGYHFVIKRNGTLETGRDRDKDGKILEETGAHVYGFNRGSIGVCLVGRGGNYTEEQFTTLESLIKILSEFYPEAEILGHCDLDPKKPNCPGFSVKDFVKKIYQP